MLHTEQQVKTILLPSVFQHSISAIKKTVPQYQAISLNEIQVYALQNRTDTKYLIRLVDIPSILSSFSSACSILETNSQRISEYRTLYYDTPALTFYYDHHNGKRPRFKIRMRKYLTTKDTFLEIKKKENNWRTVKNRIPITTMRQSLTSEMYTFLAQFYEGTGNSLKPVIWNTFKRITLVNKSANERITIDLGLSFFNQTNSLQLPHLAIVEIKQNKLNRESIITTTLKEKGYQPISISKYCTGMAFLRPDIKRNRFKQNFLQFKAATKRIYQNVNVFPVHA